MFTCYLQEISYDDGQSAKREHIKTLYEKEMNAMLNFPNSLKPGGC